MRNVKTPAPTAGAAALLDKLRECVALEARGARREIERSRALLGEAVGQLNTSFRSMEDQSQRQRATLNQLLDPSTEASPGMRQFAQAAGALIAELADVLAGDSRESVKTVQMIDEMVGHLDLLFDLLGGLKAERALEVAMRSTFTVGQVRTRVDETAEREMNASIEARTKADVLLEKAVALNDSLTSGIAAVADSSDKIRGDVATAVRSLQFEDIVTQSLAAANAHLERLVTINQDAIHLHYLLVNLDGTPEMRQRALEAYSRDLLRKRAAWASPMHKPVSQNDLKAGAVELF